MKVIAALWMAPASAARPREIPCLRNRLIGRLGDRVRIRLALGHRRCHQADEYIATMYICSSLCVFGGHGGRAEHSDLTRNRPQVLLGPHPKTIACFAKDRSAAQSMSWVARA